MAIRRPSISSQDWLFQDYLYQDTPEGQERYVQVKWDGQVYERVSSSYDYSNPPYSNSEQRGGHVVAQIDYTLYGNLVTITNWSVDWRDEWPLRLAVNYVINCLYSPDRNYVHRVVGDEVYRQDGSSVSLPSTTPYSFWVSEQFFPASNNPSEYLVYAPVVTGSIPNPQTSTYSASISPNPAVPGSVLHVLIETENVSLGTPLYWRITGPGVTPAFFVHGMSGKVEVGK